jgi:hypothetical protein
LTYLVSNSQEGLHYVFTSLHNMMKMPCLQWSVMWLFINLFIYLVTYLLTVGSTPRSSLFDTTFLLHLPPIRRNKAWRKEGSKQKIHLSNTLIIILKKSPSIKNVNENISNYISSFSFLVSMMQVIHTIHQEVCTNCECLSFILCIMSCASACYTDTTPTLHRYHPNPATLKLQHTSKQEHTTNVVIQ